MSNRTASCSCGQLRIEVEGEPQGVGVCHCLACQRRTGSVFTALASFRAPFKVFGTATEYVRTGDHGARFRFRFCPVCGTTVFHTEEGVVPSRVAVAVGTFADPSFPPPQDSVHDCRRHTWVQLPPGIKTYEKDPAEKQGSPARLNSWVAGIAFVAVARSAFICNVYFIGATSLKRCKSTYALT